MSNAPTPPPPKTSASRADIQGLRAAAVLLVVLFHAGLPVSGGFLGVDMFFVISGFVITSSLVRELERTGTADLRRFYVRRAKRLLPALALMLTTVLVASIALAPAGIGHEAAVTGLTAAVFGSNIYLYFLPTSYFAIDQQLNPLLHTWTLGVEEQFYVIFPLLLVVAWLRVARSRGRGSPRRFAALTLTVFSLLSLLVSVLWWHGWEGGWSNSPTELAYYSSLARGWEFGLGAVLALGAAVCVRIPAVVAALLGLLGAAAIAVAVTGTLDALGGGPTFAAIGVVCVGTFAVIAAGLGAPRNPVSRLLAQRTLVFVGDRSYSLYLWHWPLIVFARALLPGSGAAPAIAAALSIAPAWLSYRFIENPIRFAPRIRGLRALAVAGTCIALPVVAGGGVLWAESALPNLSYPAALHADRLRGCDAPAPFGSPSRVRCTWAVRRARGTIVLVGDSNAGQFTEPVVAAGNRARYTVKVATLHGCPFVQLEVIWRYAPGCPAFDRESLPALVRARPSLVIIAGRDDEYLMGTQAGLGPLGGGSITHDPARKTEFWSGGLRREVTALTRAGIPVLLVRPIPNLKIDQRSCASLLLWTGRCRSRMSRSRVDDELRSAIEAEDRGLQGLRGTSLLDFESVFCSATLCDARVLPGGATAYVDSNHLSVAGARVLTPRFYAAIVTHARPTHRGGVRWRSVSGTVTGK